MLIVMLMWMNQDPLLSTKTLLWWVWLAFLPLAHFRLNIAPPLGRIFPETGKCSASVAHVFDIILKESVLSSTSRRFLDVCSRCLRPLGSTLKYLVPFWVTLLCGMREVRLYSAHGWPIFPRLFVEETYYFSTVYSRIVTLKLLKSEKWSYIKQSHFLVQFQEVEIKISRACLTSHVHFWIICNTWDVETASMSLGGCMNKRTECMCVHSAVVISLDTLVNLAICNDLDEHCRHDAKRTKPDEEDKCFIFLLLQRFLKCHTHRNGAEWLH